MASSAATEALGQLCLDAAEAWRPQPYPPVSEWAEQQLRIPYELQESEGPFDLDDRPFWREPLDALRDPEVQTITVVKAAQLGGTVSLIFGGLASLSEIAPAPGMFAGPDRDVVAEKRDQFYSFAEASPLLAPRVPRKIDRNMRAIDLETMQAFLAWSGSKQRLSGRACKYVFCTEVDRWQESPKEGRSAHLIRQRVRTFDDFKILYESTPSDDASTIWALWLRSDRRYYLAPCLHCGHFQALRVFPHKRGKFAGRGGIAGAQDASGQWLDADAAREAAHYVCEKGCRIESDEKPEMIERGIWAPAGRRVEGGKLAGRAKRSGRNRGYHISALYAPTVTFGSAIADYLDSREDPKDLQSFINNFLALKHRRTATLPMWRDLGRRLSGGYTAGVVPSSAFFLTAGADVQEDRVYYVVRAWGDAATSWLVGWGMYRRPDGAAPDAHVAYLGELLEQTWPLASPNALGDRELPLRILGVDCGYKPRWVNDFCRQYPGDQVRAVAGDRVPPGQLWRRSIVERNARTGQRYEGGLERWALDVDYFKEDLQDRWNISRGQAGAWLLPADCVELGEDYLRQVVNEGPIHEIGADGRQRVVWRVRDTRTGNHYWDCEVYARALAEMVVGRNWSAADWIAEYGGQADGDAGGTDRPGARIPDPQR